MQRVLLLVICIFLVCSWATAQKNRSIDGSQNHTLGLGMAQGQLSTITPISFSDKISTPTGQDRLSPREISNMVFAQDGIAIPSEMELSDYVWAFGQFVSHDISLVKQDNSEPAYIVAPDNDEFFTPGAIIPMSRSLEALGTGTDETNPRKYVNEITAFLDLSSVYGSDIVRSYWLRENDGTGKLKTSQGNLLPWNTEDQEFNSPLDDDRPVMETASGEINNEKLFVAGDQRANENPLLLSFHTLFVREHNRLCEELVSKYPQWLGNDEIIYQRARKLNTALYQSIVYNEWLPTQGVILPNYNEYVEMIDPRVSNVFSAAAFRLGHTLINHDILRMNDSGIEINQGNLILQDAFFNPVIVNLAGGIDPYFKGMATQVQQELDCKVIDDVRNFLFSEDGNLGLDLAAININRGRERGIADYNTLRESYGLPRVSSFIAITDDQESADLLASVYDTVDDIDPWVGLLSEDHLNDALFGDLLMHIIEDQFQRLRDGDRYFYLNDSELSATELDEIDNIALFDVVMRNTDIQIMQNNLFSAMPHEDIPNGPELTQLNLEVVAYPNPAFDQFYVKVFVEFDMMVNVWLYDPFGRMIKSGTKQMYKGDNFIPFDLDDKYPRGIYNVVMESANRSKVIKVIKEK